MIGNFVVCATEARQIEWLQGSLISLGQVIAAGDSLEELSALVDTMQAAVAFVAVDRQQQVQQCALIESLLEARPLVAVIAIGDGYDSDLVIASMRAGARDFLTTGQRGSEVLGLVRRQLSRMPRLPQPMEQAEVILLYGAQADADAALVAAHLGLTLCGEDGEAVLLMDIGLPSGESQAVLGLECTFYFEDAIRNLRRLDSSVIESAFAQHAEGLHLLPLGDEPFQFGTINSSELFLLLGSLKQYFGRIVINMSGQRDGTLVRTLVGMADHLLWYADQSVPGNRRNLNLLQHWRDEGIKLDHAMLVVDRYLDKAAPDAATLARSFDMPLAGSLPLSAALRLESRNQGIAVNDLAPRDPLSRALERLAGTLAQGREPRLGFWQRLRGQR
ncbi:MAG TPA: pilus assembly protein [Hyphomicrobiales bacterium]|nr:pilus assembly protein [Hyphomicrobiales bacterium]